MKTFLIQNTDATWAQYFESENMDSAMKWAESYMKAATTTGWRPPVGNYKVKEVTDSNLIAQHKANSRGV